MDDQEYLIFRNGADRTNEVIYTSQKRAQELLGEEQDITHIALWKTVDDDRVASNYLLDANNMIVHSPPSPPQPTYKELREAEYAKISIGDQLDAIYKYALANGVVPDPNAKTDTPEGWVAKIQSIKETYPKE